MCVFVGCAPITSSMAFKMILRYTYTYIQYQDDNQPGIDRIDNTLKKDYENHDIFGFDSIC